MQVISLLVSRIYEHEPSVVFRLELEAVHIVSERLPLINNDPKNANPLDSLSQAALDDAERLLREAIAHSPRYASAHNNLAQVLRMKHDADGTLMTTIGTA